MVDSLSQRPG